MREPFEIPMADCLHRVPKGSRQCSKGARLLKGYKIREKSVTRPSRRHLLQFSHVLSFDDAKHWVDVYSSRFKGDIPPVQMRVCAKFKPDTGHVPSDAPCIRVTRSRF